MAYSQVDTLEDLRWKNRVVLLFADGAENLSLKAQQKFIKKDKLGYEDRELVVISDIIGDKNRSDLRSKFNISEKGFTFILIGKDGGEKLRRNTVVQSIDLFDLIDSMPMRQSEMRNRKIKK